jgi:DNA-binding NtrC family response regulator
METAFRALQVKCSSTLVASPDADFRARIVQSLASSEGPPYEVRGGAEALKLLKAAVYKTLLVDRWLADLDVDELAETVRTRHPDVRVVIVDSKADTVGDSSAGKTATQTLPPVEPAFPEPLASWSDGVLDGRPLPGMVGASEAMQLTYKLARLVAPRTTPVLITGETGTGKELVARGIHAASLRSKQRFVVANCAAIPDTLLEAELFGFTRGAFTGAFQSRLGRIQSAQGGTLLLDEVGEMPLSMQSKLLRFLQEGEVQPLGSPEVFRVDVRVLAATNAQLEKRVRDGRFRDDLYYRLTVFPINLTPLRERREDIIPLAKHFLEGLALESGLIHNHFTRQAKALLESLDWPGNVRQLQHCVERAFILTDGNPEIQSRHL